MTSSYKRVAIPYSCTRRAHIPLLDVKLILFIRMNLFGSYILLLTAFQCHASKSNALSSQFLRNLSYWICCKMCQLFVSPPFRLKCVPVCACDVRACVRLNLDFFPQDMLMRTFVRLKMMATIRVAAVWILRAGMRNCKRMAFSWWSHYCWLRHQPYKFLTL